jgi:hypothetical protein
MRTQRFNIANTTAFGHDSKLNGSSSHPHNLLPLVPITVLSSRLLLGLPATHLTYNMIIFISLDIMGNA